MAIVTCRIAAAMFALAIRTSPAAKLVQRPVGPCDGLPASAASSVCSASSHALVRSPDPAETETAPPRSAPRADSHRSRVSGPPRRSTPAPDRPPHSPARRPASRRRTRQIDPPPAATVSMAIVGATAARPPFAFRIPARSGRRTAIRRCSCRPCRKPIARSKPAACATPRKADDPAGRTGENAVLAAEVFAATSPPADVRQPQLAAGNRRSQPPRHTRAAPDSNTHRRPSYRPAPPASAAARRCETLISRKPTSRAIRRR